MNSLSRKIRWLLAPIVAFSLLNMMSSVEAKAPVDLVHWAIIVYKGRAANPSQYDKAVAIMFKNNKSFNPL